MLCIFCSFLRLPELVRNLENKIRKRKNEWNRKGDRIGGGKWNNCSIRYRNTKISLKYNSWSNVI